MAKDPAFLFYSSDFLTGTMFLSDAQVGKYIRLLCAMHQKGRLSKEDMLSICKTHDNKLFAKFDIDENGLYFNSRLEKEAKKRSDYSESRRKNRLKSDSDNVMTYLMINHMNNHIKIGSSNNPERRLLEIRSQLNNNKIDLLAWTKPQSQKIESELHRKYYLKHMSLEWFSLSKKDISNIMSSYHMIGHMENENVIENKDDNKTENELNIWPTFDDFWNLYDKKSGDKRKCLKKWGLLQQLGKEFIMVHVEKYVKSTPDKQFRKNPETYLNQKHWENEILTNEENGRGNNIQTVQKYIDIISEQGN